jgi:regulatory protein
LLARREHTELELSRKLRAKGFSDNEIEATLTALIAENLLNNVRFIESYIHYRRQKGYGPLHIHAALNARGMTEDMIEHHLNITDNAWFALARKTWQKRFKGIYPTDFKIRAQHIRFLQYRGFTPEQINSIFKSDDEHE